jgi:hypothetical protein
MKVLVSHDCEALYAQTEWFHQEEKQSFKKCAIHVPYTCNAGWLQYSLPYTDSELLQQRLTSKIGQPLELRWMVINDGTRTQGMDWNKLPKALHIFCETKQENYVQDQLHKIYGSKVKEFPMKTKMRFVKPMSLLCNQESIAKYKQLRHDQRLWCEHAHRRTVTGLQCLEMKLGKTGDKMTQKERILWFQMEVQKKDGSTVKTQVFKGLYLHVSSGRTLLDCIFFCKKT